MSLVSQPLIHLLRTRNHAKIAKPCRRLISAWRSLGKFGLNMKTTPHIIYEDEQLVAVYKPPGWHSVPQGKCKSHISNQQRFNKKRDTGEEYNRYGDQCLPNGYGDQSVHNRYDDQCFLNGHDGQFLTNGHHAIHSPVPSSLLTWLISCVPQVSFSSDREEDDLNSLTKVTSKRISNGLLTRLDYPTSGLMLAAKTRNAYDDLHRQMIKSKAKDMATLEKTYIAFSYWEPHEKDHTSLANHWHKQLAPTRQIWNEKVEIWIKKTLEKSRKDQWFMDGRNIVPEMERFKPFNVSSRYRPFGLNGHRVKLLLGATFPKKGKFDQLKKNANQLSSMGLNIQSRSDEFCGINATPHHSLCYTSRIEYLSAWKKNEIEKQSGNENEKKMKRRFISPTVIVSRVTIHRGFRHQIRSHLAHIGLPIIGDSFYSPRNQLEFNQIPQLIPQIGLVAVKVKFIHPTSKKPYEITLEDEIWKRYLT